MGFLKVLVSCIMALDNKVRPKVRRIDRTCHPLPSRTVPFEIYLVTIVLIIVGGPVGKTFKPVRREVTMMIR